MASKKIFISYSRNDSEYVKTLVTALRKQGFDVWFDRNIVTGTDWDDTIEEEINNSDAVVLILSKTSAKSDNVKDEMSYAMSLGKSVNPIKIEECIVPMRLARKQYLDFTIMGHEVGFERLVKDLNVNLGNKEKIVVDHGSFVPPEKKQFVPNHHHVPKSNNSSLYIFGGIVIGGGLVVGLILLLVAIFSSNDNNAIDYDDGTDYNYTEDYSTSNTNSTIANDWAFASSTNTADAYIEFLKRYGKNNAYYNDAYTRLKGMFSESGYVKYGIVNVEQYFNKTLYFDGNEMTIPVQGDFISPKFENEIFKNNYPTGYFVQPGRFYLVMDVITQTNNEVWVHLAI